MGRPNVLLIFADQLRYSALGCNGNPTVRTPALDRLASRGISFDNGFSSCSVCSPYRGQLLTGRYSHVNEVVCNEYGLFDDQPLLAQGVFISLGIMNTAGLGLCLRLGPCCGLLPILLPFRLALHSGLRGPAKVPHRH